MSPPIVYEEIKPRSQRTIKDDHYGLDHFCFSSYHNLAPSSGFPLPCRGTCGPAHCPRRWSLSRLRDFCLGALSLLGLLHLFLLHLFFVLLVHLLQALTTTTLQQNGVREGLGERVTVSQHPVPGVGREGR